MAAWCRRQPRHRRKCRSMNGSQAPISEPVKPGCRRSAPMHEPPRATAGRASPTPSCCFWHRALRRAVMVPLEKTAAVHSSASVAAPRKRSLEPALHWRGCRTPSAEQALIREVHNASSAVPRFRWMSTIRLVGQEYGDGSARLTRQAAEPGRLLRRINIREFRSRNPILYAEWTRSTRRRLRDCALPTEGRQG